MKSIPLLLLAASALSACNPNCTDAAYEEVKAAVAAKLTSPSTATFPPLNQIQVTSHQSDTLCTPNFQGFVDAQNKFGATVRVDYFAATNRKGKNEAFSVSILELKPR
ncbi:hypothetical protein Q4578_16780 [Shimia thalassica]|uniref:hypothetical protein n=1 Tax=Shimia thalassica TaxID=1715693 RepID=UPI0026E1EE66|nr:hypothetical protein [Shimia thalassica]MDO6523254.1 hypothetical protein [Shimia thalassica]